MSAVWHKGSRASTRKTLGAMAIAGLLLIVVALERSGTTSSELTSRERADELLRDLP